MTRDELEKAVWAKAPKAYRLVFEGQKAIMRIDPETYITTLTPLAKFTDEELAKYLNPAKGIAL